MTGITYVVRPTLEDLTSGICSIENYEEIELANYGEARAALIAKGYGELAIFCGTLWVSTISYKEVQAETYPSIIEREVPDFMRGYASYLIAQNMNRDDISNEDKHWFVAKVERALFFYHFGWKNINETMAMLSGYYKPRKIGD